MPSGLQNAAQQLAEQKNGVGGSGLSLPSDAVYGSRVAPVPLVANAFDERAVQRMLEFCEDSTPWSRRLWQPGTILIGRELLEAGDPVTSVSERAIKTLHDELLGRVTFDPGVCLPPDRNSTRKLLSVPPTSLVRPGHAWNTLAAWVDATGGRYLRNWADALTSGVGIPSAECAARLIAGHLLDAGVSQTLLHRWFTYRIKHDTGTHSLASMCLELDGLLARRPRSVEILVPLAAQAPLPHPAPVGWLSSQQVRDWRAANIPDWAPIRQYGALLLSIEARDSFAAADAARDRIRAIRDRFRVGGRHEIVVSDQMWIAGESAPQPTATPPRKVQVYAFERQAALWHHSIEPGIEAAMELLAPLERGPAPAAVTGAWAAIEGLLVGPGDDAKHVAADRLALILAGSHLRAELTSLAWAHARSVGDALASEIKSLPTNQERAQRTLAHLLGGRGLTLTRPQDIHALDRVQNALVDPHTYVDSVRRSLEPALRGLYRQRNLLSHAGGTAGVALRATLERAAPLVAAGMDRIVHVALTSEHKAIELAALAAVRHEALRGQPAAMALSLLEI